MAPRGAFPGIALRAVKARGTHTHTARLQNERERETHRESAFAKGAIFLTVAHRLAQIRDVAGGEGPQALLGLCGSWAECLR